MRNQLLLLMSFVGLVLSSTESWSLPPCAETAAKSLQETLSWDACFGSLNFETGRFKGDRYIGEFKNGKGHGQGTYFWVYGDTYVGEFKDGIAHGKGIFTDANEKIYKGIFESGKFLHRKKE